MDKLKDLIIDLEYLKWCLSVLRRDKEESIDKIVIYIKSVGDSEELKRAFGITDLDILSRLSGEIEKCLEEKIKDLEKQIKEIVLNNFEEEL